MPRSVIMRTMAASALISSRAPGQSGAWPEMRPWAARPRRITAAAKAMDSRLNTYLLPTIWPGR